MKYISQLVFLFAFISHQALPCTSFSLGNKTSKQVFGKSFDWDEDHALIMVNKRNVEKTALSVNPLENGAVWTSKYASITFNQHGRDFPLGGMNEEGLVVEIMLGVAEHPSYTDPRPVVNEVQWIQYVLDSYASVPEMLRTIDNIRIQKVVSAVHYLVCDAQKVCAAIEFIGGRMVVHTGNDLVANVFANSTYDDSKRALQEYDGFGGNRPIPEDSSSLSRFVRAADTVDSFDPSLLIDPIDYSFDLIDNVALNGVWRIVYSDNKNISYRTALDRRIREISFDGQDLNCSTPVQILDIHESFEGPAGDRWEDFSNSRHRELVEKNRRMPDLLKQMVISYPDTNTRCLD